MGFLSNRRREPRTPAAATTSTATRRPKRSWRSRREPYSMATRPTFMQWLKVTWLDILTMIILGIIALVVFRAGPAGTRSFPLTVTNTGEVIYPQFAYPYRDQIIPAWLDTLLAFSIPIITFLLAQIRLRNFWDLNNSIFGLLYALEGSSVFQVIIKWLIGGLRPHFYDVCRPDPSLATQFNSTGLNGAGYKNYMFTSEICTSGQTAGIENALESFPSGHTTTIFAGAVFLYLWLNAKFKIYSNYHPAMWKLVMLYAPILGATLIGGSLTVDQSHNWYDVLAGGIIGTVFAFSAYRMVYASVWDWRTNHIPLNRSSSFMFSQGCEGSDMVLTKRAGWRAGHLGSTHKSPLPAPVTHSGGHHVGGQHHTGYTNGHGLSSPGNIFHTSRRSQDVV